MAWIAATTCIFSGLVFELNRARVLHKTCGTSQHAEGRDLLYGAEAPLFTTLFDPPTFTSQITDVSCSRTTHRLYY